MTKLKTTLLISAISVGLLANAAMAAPGDHMRHGDRPSFAELDTDGNGQLTVDELTAAKEARFAAADTNGDGGLSAEELAAQANDRRAERMVKRMDANGDGLIQIDEMSGPRGGDETKLFERMDADSDGTVTEEEFAAMGDKMRRGGERGERRGHGQGHGHGHSHGHDKDCGDDAPAGGSN